VEFKEDRYRFFVLGVLTDFAITIESFQLLGEKLQGE
jgi:hypothetical protein